MTLVERENGNISAEQNGELVITVVINGQHEVDADLLDRVLQFVMMELEVDTAWRTGPPENVQPTLAPSVEEILSQEPEPQAIAPEST